MAVECADFLLSSAVIFRTLAEWLTKISPEATSSQHLELVIPFTHLIGNWRDRRCNIGSKSSLTGCCLRCRKLELIFGSLPLPSLSPSLSPSPSPPSPSPSPSTSPSTSPFTSTSPSPSTSPFTSTSTSTSPSPSPSTSPSPSPSLSPSACVTVNYAVIVFAGKTYGLKVNRVHAGEDEGKYTVRAVNSFGKCEASCHLTITREYNRSPNDRGGFQTFDLFSDINYLDVTDLADGSVVNEDGFFSVPFVVITTVITDFLIHIWGIAWFSLAEAPSLLSLGSMPKDRTLCHFVKYGISSGVNQSPY